MITYGIGDMYVREVKEALGVDMDILSLAFTNPLPMKLIREFCESIDGEIYVIEDGYRYLQEVIETCRFQCYREGTFQYAHRMDPGAGRRPTGIDPARKEIDRRACCRARRSSAPAVPIVCLPKKSPC